MTTPVSYGTGGARWQYISDGYRKYWYLRSALRWLSIVSAVTALIIFGITYHTWADYKNEHTMYYGPILFVVAVSGSRPILLENSSLEKWRIKLTVSYNSRFCLS
jgi:hypothetical protein